MHRRLAVVVSLSILPLTASCSPAGAPAPANAAIAANGTGDELLDTSPDSLTAPDEGNAIETGSNATEG